MKESIQALQNLQEAMVEIADIVRDLDPGRVVQHDRIADLLDRARTRITQAGAFERT